AWARFFGEPLGHPVCGTITSVKQITRDAVRAFIGRHFVPANMVLALVGGVGRDRIRRALRRAFPGDGNPPRIRARRARTDGTGLLSLRRRELSQAYLVRLMAAPSDPRRVLAALAGGDRAPDRVAPARGGGGRLAPRARRAEPDGRAPRVTRREASHIATGRVYALALLITLSARVAAEPPAALGPCGP